MVYNAQPHGHSNQNREYFRSSPKVFQEVCDDMKKNISEPRPTQTYHKLVAVHAKDGEIAAVQAPRNLNQVKYVANKVGVNVCNIIITVEYCLFRVV